MGPIKAIHIDPACADEEAPIAQLEAMGITVNQPHPDLDATIYVTATKEGIDSARAAGFIPVLLMQDPDESMKLTKLEPAGGIVSLLELPDFIRFVQAQTVVVQS